MSVSTLNFSATLPPFTNTNGYNTNFSDTNLSATGNLALNTVKDNATGATTTTVTSSVTSNGLNFTESSANLNGNLLTVNYTSSNAANAAQNSGVAQSLLNTGINGTGVDFTPANSTTAGNAVTTSYATSPNKNFDLTVENAATSTGNSNNGQTIVLKSLAVVGDSLTATYQLTTDLPNNTTLAPSNAPPVQKSTITSTSPAAVNLGASFATTGISTIGDVLAATSGINFYGASLGSAQPAVQGGSQTGFSASNATLAATLNPNIDLSPSSSLQVADFANTSTDENAPSTNLSGSNGGNTGPFGAPSATGGPFTAAGSNTFSDQTNTDNFISAVASTGVYNAIANASASTIRGVGVNTVA